MSISSSLQKKKAPFPLLSFPHRVLAILSAIGQSLPDGVIVIDVGYEEDVDMAVFEKRFVRMSGDVLSETGR
ncbi:hypothetical protein HFO58_32040 [Rhizobium leguminosarum]|uniref:hypothetical protein n=1 Tax=Rhizobium leguminosarum TaxID=384 RepID=UPI001C9831D4|nr:hypothetical protein [Rhizobium leguminosarum]MBY5537723.1 hypothetical protein [Rhizobium leguminosarum]